MTRGIEVLTPFRGQMLNLVHLAAAMVVSENTITRWRMAGLLTEEWCEAFLAERALKAKAEENGVPLRVLRNRKVILGWDDDRAATTPVRPKRKPLRRHAGDASALTEQRGALPLSVSAPVLRSASTGSPKRQGLAWCEGLSSAAG